MLTINVIFKIQKHYILSIKITLISPYPFSIAMAIPRRDQMWAESEKWALQSPPLSLNPLDILFHFKLSCAYTYMNYIFM